MHTRGRGRQTETDASTSKAGDIAEIRPARSHNPCNAHQDQRTRISTRPPHNFDSRSVMVLSNWLMEHRERPFPSVEQKQKLSEITNMTFAQVSTWFYNARKRKLPQKLRTKSRAEAGKPSGPPTRPQPSPATEPPSACESPSPSTESEQDQSQDMAVVGQQPLGHDLERASWEEVCPAPFLDPFFEGSNLVVSAENEDVSPAKFLSWNAAFGKQQVFSDAECSSFGETRLQLQLDGGSSISQNHICFDAQHQPFALPCAGSKKAADFDLTMDWVKCQSLSSCEPYMSMLGAFSDSQANASHTSDLEVFGIFSQDLNAPLELGF